MPDLDLAELDRLHAEATPGLWQVHGVLGQVEITSMASTFAPFVPIAHCHYAAPVGPSGAPTFAEAVANAELIVHLVNNWDALRARIAELERKARAFDAIESGEIEWEYDPSCKEFAARRNCGKNHWATTLIEAIRCANGGETGAEFQS